MTPESHIFAYFLCSVKIVYFSLAKMLCAKCRAMRFWFDKSYGEMVHICFDINWLHIWAYLL